jgi:anaerobic magnesium-protoporphyrin IX monomethyl ester cyclase
MSLNDSDAFPFTFHRAVIIVPPIRDFYFTRHRFASLGAEIVSDLLRREGLQVNLLNFPLMKPEGSCIEIPGALDYLKPFIMPDETGRLSFFTHFRQFGPTIDQCAAMVEAVKPDICFMSLFAFCYADDAIVLAKKIKSKLPSVPLAVGGAGASVHPEYLLKKGAVDFVLCGEAEAGLHLFLREISLNNPKFNHVPNLAWKECTTVRFSPIRAIAQEKDIEIALVKTAENARRTTYSISLIRGCPKRCSFCSSALVFGRRLRTPPLDRLDNLLSSMGENIKHCGRRPVFNFEDDNLICSGNFLRESISLFRKHFPDAEFMAENGLDYTELTSEWCELLVRNGLTKFNLSLASVNRETLAGQCRVFEKKRYEETTGWLAKKGVPSVTYFICGLKKDTIESTARNLSYLYKRQTVIGISMFYAVPGLKDFTDCSLFDKHSTLLCLGSAAYPWNDSLSTDTLVTAFRLSRFINLKKSAFVSETEKQLLSVIERKEKLHTLIRGKSGIMKIIEVPGQDMNLMRSFFRKLIRI